MFNNYDVTNTLKINACSGGIYKTYRESWFERVNLNSISADKLFRKEKNFYSASKNNYYESKDYCDCKEVVVLQMIICGDMEVIAEIITREDFDKYFEKGKD